ncbi:MAG: hypothetical protein GTO63_25640, partial [Anaerolineae bacterium]|nr:hypothetical protein [Anaerolineae bacterium]NIQ81049.1 hypothetical protein [Anaerolineae bacterium]
MAFTKAGDDQAVSYVRFTVPSDGSGAPIFEETTVNDQKGYWVRARIVDGSYNVPAYVDVKSRLTGDYEFHEAKSYAPLIREWKVTYTGYKSIVNEKDVTLCRSRVDHMVRDHTSALATNTLF